MKNIHLIPTDKPSRLGYLTKKGKEVYKDLRLFDKPMPNILDSENQHIYITSNENIKEGDYRLNIQRDYFKKSDKEGLDYYNKRNDIFKKIILTTDQDLIKDGVQAIDDDFLEWFVKNPSCESVDQRLVWNEEKLTSIYKIIIPKQEPKQKTLKEEFYKYGKSLGISINDLQRLMLLSKQQQERSYSEKEVLNFTQIVLSQYKFGNTNIEQLDLLKETLHQFKNK